MRRYKSGVTTFLQPRPNKKTATGNHIPPPFGFVCAFQALLLDADELQILKNVRLCNLAVKLRFVLDVCLRRNGGGFFILQFFQRCAFFLQFRNDFFKLFTKCKIYSEKNNEKFMQKVYLFYEKVLSLPQNNFNMIVTFDKQYLSDLYEKGKPSAWIIAFFIFVINSAFVVLRFCFTIAE